MKITVKVDRFTQLRADIRKAYTSGTVDDVEAAGYEFTSYMRNRWCAGTLSADEQAWLDQHPAFEDYLESDGDYRDADHDAYAYMLGL